MSKLQLPAVTLICADCVDPDRAIHSLEKCTALCDFGAVKLLTSKPTYYPHRVECRHLGSINEYSAFCLKDIYKFVDTSHMLIVQHDGWILNPKSWNNSWLSYDYIGPLFQQHEFVFAHSVGSGGFSLRSRRLMEYVSTHLPPWDGVHSFDQKTGNSWGHEDGVICHYMRYHILQAGFVFGTPEDAAWFGYTRGCLPEKYKHLDAFGFHGHWPELLPQGVSSELVLSAVDKMREARRANQS